ncbi:EF-hand calcium-binding domain-containing protein 14-like isoform X3 [Montipora capricornis]|uniref:EF-hand calcium-binding domain-containing protein 14-like isoform X3 n=1 Tax=Montipora capricornis TaxID=246305 RepID=UPI0035F1B8D4
MLLSIGMGKRKREMKLSSRKNGTLVPDDDSDSDLQEFTLPKKRIIKPGKSTYVARRRCGCCRVCASVFLSLLLIASVLCVIVLGWFSLRLKRDLDFVRKRLSKVESYDRSTTREYGDLSKDMNDKYQRLKASDDDAIKFSNEHFRSILKQIVYLNLTVADLQKRVKKPENANTLTKDIDSLKKGMADTGGEITELKDKVKQLTHLAGQEHEKVELLTAKLFNLSVQVAEIMGRPTPKPPQNTGTPPLILRMPVSSDENTNSEDKVSFKNITTTISAEVARVMGIVTTVNNTLTNKVVKLRDIMKSLLKEVRKHVAIIGDLQTKVSQMVNPNNTDVVLEDHHGGDNKGVVNQLFNLSHDVSKLSEDVSEHSRQLAELVLDLTQVNQSRVLHEHESTPPEKSTACSCLAEVGKLWEQLSSNKLEIESVKEQLESFNKSGGELMATALQQVVNETTMSQNQSEATNSPADAEEELELEDMESEPTTPSPTKANNVGSILLVKVEKVTQSSPINNSTLTLSKPGNSSLESTAPLNGKVPSEVKVTNSTDTSQSSGESATKLPTESSEETLEESLEKL